MCQGRESLDYNSRGPRLHIQVSAIFRLNMLLIIQLSGFLAGVRLKAIYSEGERLLMACVRFSGTQHIRSDYKVKIKSKQHPAPPPTHTHLLQYILFTVRPEEITQGESGERGL